MKKSEQTVTTIAMIKSVWKLALPKSPKVQITAAESPTSVAKYCSKVVAAVQMLPIAIPARTTLSEENERNLHIPKISNTEAKAKTKATELVAKGFAEVA